MKLFKKGVETMDERKLLHDFGRNLKDLLNESCMCQRELSELTGISEPTISRYVVGDAMPSLVNIVKIMRALECTFEDLVD